MGTAMANPRGDIQGEMDMDLKRSAAAGVHESGSGAAPLAPSEFSERLESVRRTLWLTAAAVLGRPDEAEDVVQEAAVVGLQKLEDFAPSTSFAAWMGQIVRNVARNHVRKQQRRRTHPADPAALERSTGSEGAGAHHGMDADFDGRVLQAMNELDEIPRTCLLLRTVHDMPYREISDLLGIPEGTAMSHVHRSRQALRARLSDDDGRPA
jgi:RNA polymerase sigma-70 factor, ECF subfamily